MRYRIRYGSEAATKEIPALDSSIRARVQAAIESKLMIDPERFGKPLRYTLRGLRTIRVGDWRIIFQIRAGDTVVIFSVRHRKEGYGNISA